jgi:glutathione S-transferase
MSELKLYTNPMSRGCTVRWMLEEVGQPYEAVILDYAGEMKTPEYLAINPMGKVPALQHGDRIVTECAAICAYLADAFPEAGLAPPPADRHAYYRWLFFAAGPVEGAMQDAARKLDGTPETSRMLGYGSLETVKRVLHGVAQPGPYICGERFTAADIYVGSTIDWLVLFKMLDPAMFDPYLNRLRARAAYARARAIDEELRVKAAA